MVAEYTAKCINARCCDPIKFLPVSISPYSIMGILDSRRLSQFWGWRERFIAIDTLDPLVAVVPCDFRCYVAPAFTDEAGARLFHCWRDRRTCIALARDVCLVVQWG